MHAVYYKHLEVAKCLYHIGLAVIMASANSTNSDLESLILSDSTQCSTEANEIVITISDSNIILINPENHCSTLVDSTHDQCSTEVNEIHMSPGTSEVVIAAPKATDDKQAELVIGKELVITVNFLNSEIV